MKIHTIITHERPHLDEIAAIWLLRRFGEPEFPGVGNAKLETWKTGGVTPDGRSAAEWEADGHMLVGVGGGLFDEHPSPTNGRVKDECAATLVARRLNVENDPKLWAMLEYVRGEDLRGNSGAFSLGPLVKLLHETQMPKRTMDWVFMALDAKLEEQRRFANALDEFESIGKVEEVETPNGVRRVGFIISGNPSMNKASRSERGPKLDVLIQKNPDLGQVYVFGNRQRVSLPAIARCVRIAERRERGFRELNGFTQADLEAEGRDVKGAECWWLSPVGLLNGSLTATEVEPTKLPICKIRQCVRMALTRP